MILIAPAQTAQQYTTRRCMAKHKSLFTQRNFRVARHQSGSAVQLSTSALPAQLIDRISDPVIRQAVKEPVAFLGGAFAGALSLTLTEEPLKTWIESTSADAGISYQIAIEQLQQQRDIASQASV